MYCRRRLPEKQPSKRPSELQESFSSFMFPPFVDFAEKVRLFEAHFVQNADIIHRRFRLVNRRDKLFFTAFGCVRLKTLTRQKQFSTVLFRDVFLPFSLSECVRHQKNNVDCLDSTGRESMKSLILSVAAYMLILC